MGRQPAGSVTLSLVLVESWNCLHGPGPGFWGPMGSNWGKRLLTVGVLACVHSPQAEMRTQTRGHPSPLALWKSKRKSELVTSPRPLHPQLKERGASLPSPQKCGR